MAKANASAAKTWNILPAGYRTMTITAVREFPGRTPDPETGEMGYIVGMTYTDKETGQQVLQNYSLLKPTFLREVLLAVANGDETHADHLLDNIDWSTADAEAIMDIEVKAYVTQGTYLGRPNNSIGRVISLSEAEKIPAIAGSAVATPDRIQHNADAEQEARGQTVMVEPSEATEKTEN